MATEGRIHVYLCGGEGASAAPELKKLEWGDQGESENILVDQGSELCRAEGRERIAQAVAKDKPALVIIGACPLAIRDGRLTKQLLAAGLDEDAVVELDLFDKPTEGRCQGLPLAGADKRLVQVLSDRLQPAEKVAAGVPITRRVLVLGNGLTGSAAVRELAELGLETVWLKPEDDNLADLETFADPQAEALVKANERILAEADKVERFNGARLLKVDGAAGRFTARFATTDGGPTEREVGAVVVAQGPPTIMNPGPVRSVASDRVVPLSRLVAGLRGGDDALIKGLDKSSRIGLTVGLGDESRVEVHRVALWAAEELVDRFGAEVALIEGNTKVASPELEERTRNVRERGVWITKTTDTKASAQVEGDLVKLDFRDETLNEDLGLELDLLVVDEVPSPDDAYHRLGAALGLAVTPEGALQPDRVNALPTMTPRVGVLAVGPARGSSDLIRRVDEAKDAVMSIKRLFGRADEGLIEPMTINLETCARCLTCVRVCPEKAMGFADNQPIPSPLACTGCGTCAAECPQDAIQLTGQEDDRFQARIAWGLNRTAPASDAGQEILVFLCANSASEALAAARAKGAPWPEGATFIEVSCASRIDPAYILFAFNEGYDGVMVASCFQKACYSLEGSNWLAYRTEHVKRLLEESGVDPQRLLRVGVGPNMSLELVDALERFRADLAELGPSPLKAMARAKDLQQKYTARLAGDFTLLN